MQGKEGRGLFSLPFSPADQCSQQTAAVRQAARKKADATRRRTVPNTRQVGMLAWLGMKSTYIQRCCCTYVWPVHEKTCPTTSCTITFVQKYVERNTKILVTTSSGYIPDSCSFNLILRENEPFRPNVSPRSPHYSPRKPFNTIVRSPKDSLLHPQTILEMTGSSRGISLHEEKRGVEHCQGEERKHASPPWKALSQLLPRPTHATMPQVFLTLG